MKAGRQEFARREAGFSLIETVMALALLAIVLSLLTTALNASRLALKNIAVQGGQQSFVASMRYVEQRLADSQPLYVSRIGNEARVQFVGAPDRVLFLTAIEGADFPGGMYKVEFGRLGTNSKAVSLRMTPYARDRLAEPPPSYEKVIDASVSHFEIEYFGPDPDRGTGSWQAVWRDRNMVPFAVRVKVRKNGKSAEEVYIPLRAHRAVLGVEEVERF